MKSIPRLSASTASSTTLRITSAWVASGVMSPKVSRPSSSCTASAYRGGAAFLGHEREVSREQPRNVTRLGVGASVGEREAVRVWEHRHVVRVVVCHDEGLAAIEELPADFGAVHAV